MILIYNKELSKLKFSDVEVFLDNTDLDESFFVEFKNDKVTTKDLQRKYVYFLIHLVVIYFLV